MRVALWSPYYRLLDCQPCCLCEAQLPGPRFANCWPGSLALYCSSYAAIALVALTLVNAVRRMLPAVGVGRSFGMRSVDRSSRSDVDGYQGHVRPWELKSNRAT